MKPLTRAICLLILISWAASLCPAQQESTTPAQEDPANPTTTAGQAQEATKNGTQSLEEALDKKPGINFSSVQIGGQSSGISLSSIQADSVESLDALKLATPDMDADIVGGTLNLKFRPAYAQRRPTRQIRAYITYYELAGKPGPSVYLTQGQAFGNGHRWGYLLNARAYQSSLGEENLNRDWQLKPKSQWPTTWRFQDVQMEKESTRSDSVSANLLLDYELTKKLRIYTQSIFGKTKRKEVNRNFEYEWDDGVFTALDEDSATVEGMSLYKGIEDRKNVRDTRDITLGVQYKGEDWRWESQFKYDYSHSEYPHRWDSLFLLEDIDASYQDASKPYTKFAFLNGSEERANDTSQYLFDEVRVITSSDLFVDEIVTFDVERMYTPGGIRLKLKSGIKFLQRELDSTDNVLVYDESTQPLTIAQFESPWASGKIHEGEYSLSGFHDPTRFREYFQTHPEEFILNETQTRSQTDPAVYTVNESIGSAYLMTDFIWNKWRILAGMRMERTEDEFTGKEVLFDENGDYQQTLDASGGRTYTNFFPGIHAVYSASDKLTVYTSWSQALERPRYYYLAPFRRVLQRSQYIRAGNPDLKATVFTSFLAAADWAYDKSGFLSLELLRRNNDDIVVESQTLVKDGQFEGYDLYTWDNAGKATLNQVQLVWNQELDPLWYQLDGLSFEMRYRFNDTETNVRGPDAAPLPIALVPENDIRASFIYENQNWEFRFRADHNSEMLRRIGATPERDTYSYESTSYDFTVEYQASSGWTGSVGVYNINEDSSEMYFGDPGRPSDLISRGRFWRTSVRYSY